MSNLKMLIYTAFDGVQTTLTWANEDEFQAGKKFLQNIGAHVMGISENNKPTGGVFVDVDNKQQMEAFGEFLTSLRPKRKSD